MDNEKTIALLYEIVQNPLLEANVRMFKSDMSLPGLDDDEEVFGWIASLAFATEEAIKHLAGMGIVVNYSINSRMSDKRIIC